LCFLVSRKRVERLTEPDVWSLISFIVSRKRVERLTEPDVWKPFLIVLTTFTLQIWVGTAAIGEQTLDTTEEVYIQREIHGPSRLPQIQ
jgi:hypothetical protein